MKLRVFERKKIICWILNWKPNEVKAFLKTSKKAKKVKWHDMTVATNREPVLLGGRMKLHDSQ
jgi:hypothetical protein